MYFVCSFLLAALTCGMSFVTASSPAAEPAKSAAPLADAAERADWRTVAALLDEDAEVNAAQTDGMTALHWAVYHDDVETAKRLAEAGAQVNATNRYGVAPLSIACTNGNAIVVELLLQAGADPNTALRGGETALMTAARTGILAAVKTLIDRGADVNATEQNGQTAIMWAAAEGHVDVVSALIEAGADFGARLDSGFTPLFFAVREGRTDVVLALLRAGADVDQVMRPKRREKHAAHRGVSPLILAVENAHFELAAALLEAGADPNDMRTGFTALHTITWVRKPNSGDEGLPPPIGSGHLSSLQFVRKLVEHGADVNARAKRRSAGKGELNRYGATPFLLAADTADVPLMKLLVELGADPTLPNADNATPLMAAAGLGTLAPREEAGTEAEALEAVQLAFELGGDLNAIDDNGETAMHGAAYASFPKIVRWLADHGAREDVWNRRNKYGWTPRLIAQGYRPGNFKPAAETIEAIEQIMSAEARAVKEVPPKMGNDY
jgi:ankyrin repeat protein